MKISTNPANPNEFHYALVYPIPSTGGKGYSYAVVAVISRDAYANRLPDSFKNLKARTVTPSGVGSKVSNSVITVDTPITPEESAANFIMTDTQDNPSNALKVKYKPYEVGGKNESKLTESKYNSILNHIRKAGFTVKESEIEIRVLNDRTEKELYKKYPGISMQLAKGMPYLIIPTDQAPSTPIIIRLSPKKISKKNFKSELEILTKYIETVEQFQELTKDLAAKGLITKPLMLGGNRSFAAMISAMSNIYQNIRPDENGNIRSLGQDITLDKITKAHPFYGQLYSFIMDAANNKANTTPEGVKIFDQSIFEQYEPMFKLAYEMDSMVHGERVKKRNLRGPAQKIFDKIAKSNLVWFPNDSTQDVVILRNERTIYVGKNKKEITGARSLLGAADPKKEAIMLTGKVANSIRRKIAQRFTKVFGRELTPEDQAVIDNLDIPKSLPTNDGLIRTVFTTEELRAILNLDDKGESNVNNGFGLRVPIQTSMVNNKKMPGKGGAINPEIEIALEEHFETNFETILPTKMSIFMQPNSDFGMEPFPTAPEAPTPPADTPPAPVSNDPSTIGSLLDPDTHISDYEPTSENINNYSEATTDQTQTIPTQTKNVEELKKQLEEEQKRYDREKALLERQLVVLEEELKRKEESNKYLEKLYSKNIDTKSNLEEALQEQEGNPEDIKRREKNLLELVGIDPSELQENPMFPMQSEGVRKNMDEIEEIAKRLPMSPELRNLFNLVLPVAKQLGVFVDLLANSLYLRSEGALGQYDMVTNTTSVELFPFKFSPNYAAITDKGYAKLAQGDAGFLARNLTHELIHAVTRYATFLYQEQDNEVLQETFLTEKQIKAIEGLISLLDILNNDPDFVLEYGAKNIDELLANLTDPVFVKKLKNKTLSSGQSLYQRFLELILQLFNKKVTAYDELTYILAELLSEPSPTQLALAEVEAS